VAYDHYRIDWSAVRAVACHDSATVVAIFGVMLFSYVLKVPMPILEWRGTWM